MRGVEDSGFWQHFRGGWNYKVRQVRQARMEGQEMNNKFNLEGRRNGDSWRRKPGNGVRWKGRGLLGEIGEFLRSGSMFLGRRLAVMGKGFEGGKNWLAGKLYQQRGKWARPFSHISMGGLTVIGFILAPILASEYSSVLGFDKDGFRVPDAKMGGVAVLAASDWVETATVISDKPRDRVVEYVVQPGDTVSGIASKFGVSEDTIRWQNDLKSINAIKPGQTLEILPVSGVLHKVKAGETVYSIAKKYEANPQAIVDFPFNTFTNDETFVLAIGQELMVPDGVKPEETLWSPRSYVAQRTPDAGAVTASGQFVWPTGGTITQRYSWYHKGIDIANRSAPGIVAADSGKVIVAGWPDRSGYGNRVMVDHGNGFVTLYAHLQKIYVTEGQTVKRGDVIGQMGSTGRSTGTHLHFEVRLNGVALNPLGYLK